MTDTRVERRLGWVTADQQEYPSQKAADWQDAVRQGLCPFCSAGPFEVVALHVYQRHGIRTRELRDLLGLTVKESISSPEHQERLRAHCRERESWRPMVGLHPVGPHPVTKAGRARWGTVDRLKFHADSTDERHGTVNGYNNLKCRCVGCKEAWAFEVMARRQRWVSHPRTPLAIEVMGCPTCSAQPGVGCRTRAGGTYSNVVHRDRRAAFDTLMLIAQGLMTE